MVINHLALIASGLIRTLAARVRHTGSSVSEAILFWLQIRQLTEALDGLFSAWRSGDLPPLPQPAILEATPAPARAPCAAAVRPRPSGAQRHNTPRASITRPAPAAALPPVTAPAPASPPYVVRPRAAPQALAKRGIVSKMRHFSRMPMHAHIVPISK